jgi:hypothetical protein
VDALKIDQSFVRRIATDKNTTAIVTSIVAMARELGLSVIAEGVESEAQRDALRALNCEAVQGYFYAAPLEAEAAGRYLQTGPVPASIGNDGSNESPDERERRALAKLLPFQPWMEQWLSWLGQRAVAASAVIGVVILAGVGAVFYGASRFTPADLPAVASRPAWPTKPYDGDPRFSLDNSQQLLAGRASVTTGSPAASAAASAGEKPAIVSPAPPPAVSSTAAAAAHTAFEVEHLHKFGRCHGRLMISADGVRFAVNGNERGDGFSLRHGEFVVQAIDDHALVIRTAKNKVYRFSPPDKLSGKLGDALIAQMADTIVRSQPR